jgi:hypothetical protein
LTDWLAIAVVELPETNERLSIIATDWNAATLKFKTAAAARIAFNDNILMAGWKFFRYERLEGLMAVFHSAHWAHFATATGDSVARAADDVALVLYLEFTFKLC